MAGRSIKKYALGNNKGKYSLGNSSSSSGTGASTDKMQSQINNYKTRLQAAGSDYDASDTRNPLEKFLNLEKDQNVLFDILEIINRPQNALLTGIDKAMSGEDFGEGLKEGITGETKTTGKDLLLNHTDMEDETGKLDLVDALGFGVDLISDPLDWALIPVTGGASKAAELGLDATQAATKGAKALNTIDNVTDAAQAISKGAKALDTVDNAVDVAQAGKKALNYSKLDDLLGLSDMGVHLASGNELIGKAAGKAIKGTGKLADKAIEGTLGAIDNRNAKKIQALVDTGMSTTEAANTLGINPNKLGVYQDLKKGAKNLVNSSANIEGLVGRSREVEGTSELLKRGGKFTVDELDNEAKTIAENIAKRTGANVEDTYDKIAKSINTAVESNYDWTIRGDELLDDLMKNKRVDLFTPKQADDVVKELNSYGIKNTVEDGRYVRILDNKQKLNNLKDDFSSKIFGNRLSSDDINDIKEATDFIQNNPELKQFYNKANDFENTLAKSSDTITGLQSQNIAREGHVSHVLTDDAKEALTRKGGSNNQFNTRKYNMTANEANRQKELERIAKQEKINKSIAKRNEVVGFSTDNEGKLVIDKDNLPEVNKNWLNEQTTRKQTRINELNKNLESAQELQKLKTDNINIDVNKLSKKDKRVYGIYEATKNYDDTIQNLKKVKFDNIPAEHSQVIKDVRLSINDYKKANTKLVNAIKNGSNEDVIKTLRENTNSLKKQLTVQVRRADTYANKTSINTMQKAFKEGKEVGKELQSALTAKRTNTKLLDELFTANGDNIVKLQNTIKLKEAELKKFVNASDKVWQKQVDTLINLDEANKVLSSREGQQFFKTNYFDNMVEYVNRNAEFTKGAQIYNEALQTNIFNNKDYIKFADDLKDGKIPYGFQKVNGTYLKNKLSKYDGILPEGSKNAARILNSFEGKDIYMDKQLVNMFNVGAKTTSSEINPLLKVWDGMNNVFKKFSTLTPGFQMRNIVGNSTDMVLSGVNPTALPGAYKKAASIWNNADDLIAKATKGTLNEAESKQFEILQQFYKGGFADAMKKGYGLEEVTKAVNKQTKNPINKLSKLSIDANEKVDAYNRLALLIYANENPKYLAKLGKKTPIDAVRHVLFDPNNLSDAEKSFKRIVPFYTFTKQNLMFQADNLMKNTGRYSKLYKALRDSYNDLDENSYYSYQRDAMQIPLPFTGEDGNQIFLKTNLPVSDLGEFLSNPIQRTLASTSPLIKAPVEMATGKSLFTGDDTNYKVLSNTLQSMGINDRNVENTAQAAELILNNFGLQNVSTNLIKKVQTVLDNSDEETSPQQLWSEIFRSILQNTKQENVINSGLYDELERYQAEIKRLKNQGTEVPTIKELKAASKISLNKLKKKRAKYSL